MLDEPRFPLAQATAFLIQIKTADGEMYSPPDVSGELEGQFLAPKEEVVRAITQLIENELKTGYAYLTYANTLRGLSRQGIAEEFMDHAAQETEHTDYLLRRLSVLAGTAPLPDIPAPPPLTDPDEIVQTMIRIEQEGIAKWRLLRSLIGDENPMRFKVEEFLTREQHHLDELWQLRPHTPDLSPVPEKVATQLPAAFSLALRSAGRAGDLSPELQEAFSKRLLRNQILGGVAGAGLGGVSGYYGIPHEDDRDALVHAGSGAALGGVVGALAGRMGTRRISGLNKALEKARSIDPSAEGGDNPITPLFKDKSTADQYLKELEKQTLESRNGLRADPLFDELQHRHYGSIAGFYPEELLYEVPELTRKGNSKRFANFPSFGQGRNKEFIGQVADYSKADDPFYYTILGNPSHRKEEGWNVEHFGDKRASYEGSRLSIIRDIVEERGYNKKASQFNEPDTWVRDPSREHLDKEEKRREPTFTEQFLGRGGVYVPGKALYREGYLSGTQKEKLEHLRKVNTLKNILGAAGDVGYGAAIGGGLGAATNSKGLAVGGMGLGAALGALKAYYTHRKDKALEDKLHEVVAPRADTGKELRVDRWDGPYSKAVRPIIIGGHMGAAVGSIPYLSKKPMLGVPLFVGGASKYTENIAEIVRDLHLGVLEARAQEYAKKHHQEKEASLADYLRAKMAAENPAVGNLGTSPMMSTEVPAALTPSGGGLTATGEMSELGAPPGGSLPQVPMDLPPEQMDPQLLQQLAVEEQGRQQQQDAAEGYFQRQAVEAQQQIQQLQMQLQQQAQQAQQLQMQLQQEQQEKQQVQQMAQQSSEVANQALSSQLQSQMQALQSRQLAMNALGQQDQFKQQLRELIDPPPAQAQMQDPSTVPQQGLPAQTGMEQQAPKMASIFSDAVDAARDFIRDGKSGRNRAITVGIPVGVGMALSLQQGFRNKSPKAQESVDQAKQHLEVAQREYEKEKNYANALRLLAAKGAVGAQEVRRDYPTAAALATFPVGYGTARTAVGLGYKARSLYDNYKARDASLDRKGLPPKTSIPEDRKAPKIPNTPLPRGPPCLATSPIESARSWPGSA